MQLKKRLKDIIKKLEDSINEDVGETIKKEVKRVIKKVCLILRDAFIGHFNGVGVKSILEGKQNHVPPSTVKKFFKKMDKIVAASIPKALKKVLPSVLANLFSDIQDAIKSAGSEAKEYTKDRGDKIIEVSFIPIYGLIKAPIMLSHLKSKSLDTFHSDASKKIKAAVGSFTVNKDAVQDAAQKVMATSSWQRGFTLYIKEMLGAV